MTWNTVTPETVTTSSRFGGDFGNKISNMFSGIDILDIVKIDSAVTWSFVNDAFRINNPADTFSYIFTPSAISANRIITIPLSITDEELVTTEATQSTIKNKSFDDSNVLVETSDDTKQVAFDLSLLNTGKTTTLSFVSTLDRTITFQDGTYTVIGKNTVDILTNKSVDADGTGNVITNIGDAETATFTTTKISTLSKSLLNTEIVYIDQTNTYQDFAQTFTDNTLKIQNPAATFVYTITGGAILADRILNIPVILGTDTLATLGLANAFTGANVFSGLNSMLVSSSGLTVRNPADTFAYTITAGAISAGRILNLPVITTTDTLAVLGLQQTFTAGPIFGTIAAQFKSSMMTIRNPADTFSYTIIGAAIGAARNLTLPLCTAADTLTSVGVANAWGAVNQNIAATGKWQEASVSISPIGVHDYWISARDMFPSTTNGAQAITTREVAAGFDISTLDFDQTTSESAQFDIVLPRSYNNGTLTYEAYWTAATGSGTVTWSIKAVSLSNGVVINTAYGTAQAVTDTLLAVNQNHISPTSSALTIAATPIDTDLLKFQISRDIADTLNADAELIGVYIHITTDAAVDA